MGFSCPIPHARIRNPENAHEKTQGIKDIEETYEDEADPPGWTPGLASTVPAQVTPSPSTSAPGGDPALGASPVPARILSSEARVWGPEHGGQSVPHVLPPHPPPAAARPAALTMGKLSFWVISL